MLHNPGFLKLVDATRQRIAQIDINGYRAMLASGVPHVLVDIREESEWAGGRVAGAVYLGKGVIERDVESRFPDRDTRLVLYCGAGYRSVLAADALQQMGYTEVISLDGGWKALQAAGLPIEK